MRLKASFLIIILILDICSLISSVDLGTARLSEKECGSPQGGVLDFLTFIGISTQITISAISAINAINSNTNNNNNNDNNNNNNNNNQNDNDNIFTVAVTNSRRKKKFKRENRQSLIRSCFEKWICQNFPQEQETEFDKLVKFFLVVGIGKTWNIDLEDLGYFESERCLSNTCII